MTDDDEAINSFAILGKENIKLDEEINKYSTEPGNEKDGSGLLGKLSDAKKKYETAKTTHENRLSDLTKKLRNKATNSDTGIKHNKLFGHANYNLSKIEEDIRAVSKNTYSPIDGEEERRLSDFFREEPKPDIPESSSFILQYSKIASKAKGLIEKKIQVSDPIQELLNNAALAEWVRNGQKYHQNKRDKCAFCGSDLPQGLWEKLDKHFNQESEKLRQTLDELLALIEGERSRVSNLLKISNSESTSYCASLDAIKEQVERRKYDIFMPLRFVVPVSAEDTLNAVRAQFEKLRNKSNQSTATLNADQSKARTTLRHHEVYIFINDIKSRDECTAINELEKAMKKTKEAKEAAKQEVRAKEVRIRELEAERKDQNEAAAEVNRYLNGFFGHPSLSLKAIELESSSPSSFPENYQMPVADGEKMLTPLGVVPRWRFEVLRNTTEKASLLSEGEKRLIAFCYFMAKLEDTETKGLQPIIWIDDPISSLDANHIFFVYSLIDAKLVNPIDTKLVNPEKDGEESTGCNRFKQLFISTHNLEFLRYLKRIPGALNKKKSQYFTITRTDQGSDIELMPKYLKNQVTEFNFLFHQIYKCAQKKQSVIKIMIATTALEIISENFLKYSCTISTQMTAIKMIS